MKKKILSIVPWLKALSWKRKVLGIVLVFLVCGITFKIIQGKTPHYTFDRVTRGTITEIVTETGNVAVSGQYDIPSPSTGLLSELYVQNGASVSAGQKLFRVTSTATPQQKQTAYASYAAAKSQLDAANAGLFSLQAAMYNAWKVYTDIAENSTYQNPDSSPNTGNRVLTPFTIAQDNWLSTEANYKNQQSVIASAQAAASSTYLTYQATQDTTVVAPVSGTVHNLDGVVGSLVTATPIAGQVAPLPVLILSTGSTLTVKATVNEVDINKINVGDTVTITFDAILDKTFSGKIIQADEFGTNVAGVVNYTIFASVEDGTDYIKPGMTANLSIDTKKHENVLIVVNGAIRPYQGVKAIQILDKKGKPIYTKVTTGIKGIDHTELISGATEGQQVILGGPAPTPAPTSAGK